MGEVIKFPQTYEHEINPQQLRLFREIGTAAAKDIEYIPYDVMTLPEPPQPPYPKEIA